MCIVADTFGEFVGHHGDKMGVATILSLGRVPRNTALTRPRIGGHLPGTLDDVAARKWYHQQLDKIPSQIDGTRSLRYQARQSFELRNQARRNARDLMMNRTKALDYDVTDPIRTWQEQIRHSYGKGNRGSAIWEDILKSSSRSRVSVDAAAGLSR